MRGVTVRLMDRDSPAPAGDDVVMPAPTTTHSSHHLPTGTISTTIKTTYERTSDETVQTATTDHAGRIRIYIPRNKLASKAGNKVVQTTRLNVDTDKETTGTIRTPVSRRVRTSTSASRAPMEPSWILSRSPPASSSTSSPPA